MARPLRLEYEGALYHVTSRGNADERIFFDDHNRKAFLDVLGDVVDRYGWLCHAYCLMTNHYHLVIETPNSNLSRGMRHLNGVYTQAINRRHRRTGHILQGRFKSILVEKDSHLLEVARYVVLNPVRAKMVRSARDWPWSSYRATSGQVPAPAFLSVGWILSQFDSEPVRATRAYRKFVQQGRSASIWDEGRTSAFLGSDGFIEQMKPLLEQRMWDVEISRSERLATRPSLETLFADALDKETRNEMVFLATRVHEYTLRDVSEFLGMHYSTISVIGKRVADFRKHHK